MRSGRLVDRLDFHVRFRFIRIRDLGKGVKILGQIAETNTQAAHTATDIPWLRLLQRQPQNVDIFFKPMRAAQGGY